MRRILQTVSFSFSSFRLLTGVFTLFLFELNSRRCVYFRLEDDVRDVVDAELEYRAIFVRNISDSSPNIDFTQWRVATDAKFALHDARHEEEQVP